MEKFDGHDYTERSALEELLLIERHSRDGSALQAGCACIEEKHLLTLAGLASEMPTLAHSKEEAEFYMNLAQEARALREKILDAHFKDDNPTISPKMERCRREVEIKCCGKETSDYSQCTCNPAAVCYASVKDAGFGHSYYPEPVLHSVTYPKGEKDGGTSTLNLLEGKIDVKVNPKLKKEPDLAHVVIQHEVDENVCAAHAYGKCHAEAVKHEPAGAREQIEALTS